MGVQLTCSAAWGRRSPMEVKGTAGGFSPEQDQNTSAVTGLGWWARGGHWLLWRGHSVLWALNPAKANPNTESETRFLCRVWTAQWGTPLIIDHLLYIKCGNHHSWFNIGHRHWWFHWWHWGRQGKVDDGFVCWDWKTVRYPEIHRNSMKLTICVFRKPVGHFFKGDPNFIPN